MKKVFFVFFCIFSLTLIGVAGSASSSAVVDRVVAVVNDEVITMSDLQREAAKLKEERADERLLLEEMINRKLQLAAAKRAGLDVTDKEVDDALEDIKRRNNLTTNGLIAELAKDGMTLEQYRAELKEQMTLSRVFNKQVRSSVSIDEAELRGYYERNKKDFSLPEEIRVRQILLTVPDKASQRQIAAVKERAAQAYERASRGEDFISLVREFSDGPARRDDGDLGFMPRDHALPEISEAVKPLSPGSIVGPVQSSMGFHIIKIEEIRKPVRPFEQVKDEIANLIYKQKIEIAYRSWLQTLRSESYIENRL